VSKYHKRFTAPVVPKKTLYMALKLIMIVCAGWERAHICTETHRVLIYNTGSILENFLLPCSEFMYQVYLLYWL